MSFKSRIIDVFFYQSIEDLWEWDFVDHIGFNIFYLGNDHSSSIKLSI